VRLRALPPEEFATFDDPGYVPRDAFAKELFVDVRQPEDNRRDQDGQCNALGIGRTGLRETTITAAARTRL
jgi:hypothetical protein